MVREVDCLTQSHIESKQQSCHSVPESGSPVDTFGPLPSAQLRAVEAGLCTFSDGEGTIVTYPESHGKADGGGIQNLHLRNILLILPVVASMCT